MTSRYLTVAMLAGAVLLGCQRSRGESAPGEASATPPSGAAPVAAATDGMPETVRLTSAAIAEAGIGTWTVKPISLEHLLILNGSVGHDENRLLQVGATVPGRVVSIRVDLGARVQKGDVLATIESAELGRAREAFVRELSSERVARRGYERAKALVAAQAISDGEFQAREGDYLTKQAGLQAAERALYLLGDEKAAVEGLRTEQGGDDGARLALRAPFAGRVIDRKITPGALFDALQPLLTLADLSSVWVFLQAYEKDLALLREGVPVTLRTEAYPQEAFKGTLDFIGSIVDASTRTVRLRATVANPAEKLRPGMFVKAQVDVPQSYEGRTVLAVPQSALQTLEDRTTLFVQTAPGVFARRSVETGHSFEGFTEAYSGVKEGDLVVTEGSFVLKSEFAKASLAEEE